MSNLDGMDVFVNDDVPSQQEEYVWEEPYQGLIEPPDMDDVANQ